MGSQKLSEKFDGRAVLVRVEIGVLGDREFDSIQQLPRSLLAADGSLNFDDPDLVVAC